MFVLFQYTHGNKGKSECNLAVWQKCNSLSAEHGSFAKECKQVLERAEQEAKDKTPEELIEEAGLTVADGDTVSALNGVL